MKITDLQEGPYDVDPKLMPYVRMGQKIASALEPGSGIEWEDVEFNKAAALGSSFGKLGSSFGPKTPGEALKDANVDIEMAKAIIAKVKGADVKPGAGVKDPEPEDPEEESVQESVNLSDKDLADAVFKAIDLADKLKVNYAVDKVAEFAEDLYSTVNGKEE